MDGAHDLGGRPGFGLIDRSQQVHFPNRWEERVFALTLACGMLGRWNLDQGRFAREQMDPEHYLASSYYEHWLHGLELLLAQTGLVSETELRTGEAQTAGEAVATPAARVPAILAKGAPTQMDCAHEPRYNLGDTVHTIAGAVPHHTRIPAYARDKRGVIVARHGGHVFPDRHARDGERHAEHLYSVEFSGETLWGPRGEPGLRVCLDLFEPYIAGRAEHAASA